MSSNCIFHDDYDGPQIYRERLRRARSAHKCCECGDTIQPGDLYENVDGLWEGSWSNYKTCARCVNVRTDFFRGWLFGFMVEDFMEAHGFDYRDGIPPDFAPCGQPTSSAGGSE